MKNRIVKKLRDVLSAGIDSECKVVYVLCECRKLLDHSRPEPYPFALRMYCNWALHVALSHKETTRRFVERVEEFVADVLAGASDLDSKHGMFREFIFLEAFREQLRNLLKRYRLPTIVCDDTVKWHQFLTHYAGVIDEGSLSCQARAPELKLVSRVVLSKGAPRPHQDSVSFSLYWQIHLLDGQIIFVDVQATPEVDPITVH